MLAVFRVGFIKSFLSYFLPPNLLHSFLHPSLSSSLSLLAFLLVWASGSRATVDYRDANSCFGTLNYNILETVTSPCSTLCCLTAYLQWFVASLPPSPSPSLNPSPSPTPSYLLPLSCSVAPRPSLSLSSTFYCLCRLLYHRRWLLLPNWPELRFLQPWRHRLFHHLPLQLLPIRLLQFPFWNSSSSNSSPNHIHSHPLCPLPPARPIPLWASTPAGARRSLGGDSRHWQAAATLGGGDAGQHPAERAALTPWSRRSGIGVERGVFRDGAGV